MTSKAFYALLNAGLWEKDVIALDAFPLSADEWLQLFNLARKQTVVGLIYRGLQHLPTELLPPDNLKLKLMIEVSRIEKRNQQHSQVTASIQQLLSPLRINPILLKGQGVAMMYEQPLLRACGDIDFYFPSDDFKRAEEFMSQLQTVEVDSAESVVYRYQGVSVEHHNRLFDCTNPFKQRYLNRLVQTYGTDTITLSNGGPITVLSGPINLLMLNLHILKHVMGWGIGLRQLCDLARAYHYYATRIDYNQLNAIYAHMGMKRWNNLLHSFLVQHLDLDERCLPPGFQQVDTQKLASIIMTGGDFGRAFRQRSGVKQSVWMQKWQTFFTFLRKSKFSMYYAPAEVLFSISTLVKGQFK